MKLRSVIGRGGMGVVYKAADTSYQSNGCALKLIRPERLTGSNAVEKLIAEGVTARDIRHPNIVAVYDVGQSDNQPFVSMEYLEGQSLRAWHREQVQKRQGYLAAGGGANHRGNHGWPQSGPRSRRYRIAT